MPYVLHSYGVFCTVNTIILLRDGVTVEGVWIGNRVYRTLTERKNKSLRQSH
jgi:hypothetical protein